MMAHHAPTRPPLAFAGPVTDDLLAHVIHHAEAAQHGHISDEAATLILMCTAPLLRELQGYRSRAADGLELAAPDNVVRLTRGEA